jgi:hypothetical protein
MICSVEVLWATPIDWAAANSILAQRTLLMQLCLEGVVARDKRSLNRAAHSGNIWK